MCISHLQTVTGNKVFGNGDLAVENVAQQKCIHLPDSNYTTNSQNCRQDTLSTNRVVDELTCRRKVVDVPCGNLSFLMTTGAKVAHLSGSLFEELLFIKLTLKGPFVLFADLVACEISCASLQSPAHHSYSILSSSLHHAMVVSRGSCRRRDQSAGSSCL